MVAYTKLQQWKKEESKRLKGERRKPMDKCSAVQQGTCHPTSYHSRYIAIEVLVWYKYQMPIISTFFLHGITKL